MVTEAASAIQDILTRSNHLLSEIQLLDQKLSHKRHNPIELRPLQSSIKADLKAISKIDPLAHDSEALMQKLRSSNLAFYETVWNVAKQSRSVTAFFRAFGDENPNKAAHRGNAAGLERTKKRPTSSVDVVADEGETWIKVATVTERTLLFDIAKQGWELDSDSDSDDKSGIDDGAEKANGENGYARAKSEDDKEDIPILKTARELVKAARVNRVHYRHPRIRLILTNIQTGRQEAIDKVLQRIQNMGVNVITGTSPGDILLDESFQRMIGDPFERLKKAETCNICCTILLAIVSDLSNSDVEKEPWLHTATKKQIEQEQEEKLLPAILWPALGNRKLVSTLDAVKRMLEIVVTIGTETEKGRTRALLDTNALRAYPELANVLDAMNGSNTVVESFNSSNDRVTAFTRLSDHPVPEHTKLPIQVEKIDIEQLSQTLPVIAQQASEHLSLLNCSVFFFGWQRGIPTITSNRATVKQIEGIIDAAQTTTNDELVGPDVWLCEVPRSLRAKDKNRKE